MNDIMLDIETFGTDSNSVIVSVSAVRFKMGTDEVDPDYFEMGVDIQSQLDKGAVIDGDTVMWWLGQSKEAQHQLLALEPMPVKYMTKAFRKWVGDAQTISLWGNGATFDNVILRNLFKRHGYHFPIPFWGDKCVKTYVDINGIDKRKFEFTGIPHKGIDDCLHQINYCKAQ